MRNNSEECFIRNADGVLRAREIRRWEPQSRWDKEAVKNIIGVRWSDRRQMDSGQTRNSSGPDPNAAIAV